LAYKPAFLRANLHFATETRLGKKGGGLLKFVAAASPQNGAASVDEINALITVFIYFC
jgi:hypothetical protein